MGHAPKPQASRPSERTPPEGLNGSHRKIGRSRNVQRYHVAPDMGGCAGMRIMRRPVSSPQLSAPLKYETRQYLRRAANHFAPH